MGPRRGAVDRRARADGQAVRLQDVPRHHRDGAAGVRRCRLHCRVRHPVVLPSRQAAAAVVVGRPLPRRPDRRGGARLTYDPLAVGGVADYPVKVGSMLLTLVDPNKGFERAYNRWYERDHFYGGCMIGPNCLAGSRWVAPRALKDERWPRADGSVATPWDAGSYVAVYFVEAGHH